MINEWKKNDNKAYCKQAPCGNKTKVKIVAQ